MSIGNLSWQARVGIFITSKQWFKTKIKNRGMLEFLLHHTIMPSLHHLYIYS